MPDDPKPSLKVFLCHAHPDADKVRALYARLKADGVDAWLDKENTCGEQSAVLSLSKRRTIIPGQDWELEIREAVRKGIICALEEQATYDHIYHYHPQ